MTDRPPVDRSAAEPAPALPATHALKPRRRRRPGPGAVIWGSVASFAALFGFLTYQLTSGHDPALGASAGQPGKAQKVLVRRVIHRRVVTTVIPPTSGASSGPSVSQSSAPTVSSPAPPAPVSPPVTTSAS